MLVLFTDSDTDMNPVLAKEYGYKVVSMPYTDDGKLVYPFVDNSEEDFPAFYDKLRQGVMPTTSAVNAQEFIDYFTPVFENGDDILFVHVSSKMTTTFDQMHQAVDMLKEKYPERKFYEIDTMGISILALQIAMEVGDMVKAGKTPEEILEWAKTEIYHYACYFTSEDLKFFARSGRVSGLSATFGALLGIHPIITMHEDGTMGSIGKEKGLRKTLDRLAQYVVDLGDDVKNHRIIVGSCGNEMLIDQVIAAVKAKIGDDIEVLRIHINPTIGAHCGPDSVGITFHSISR